jgi:hypothetical protein
METPLFLGQPDCGGCACVGLTLAAFLPHSRGSAAPDQKNPA